MTARTLSVARLGTVEYTAALACRTRWSRRGRDAIGDTLLLLEHPHVYTLGRGADARYILNATGGSADPSRLARRPGHLSRTGPTHRLSDPQAGGRRPRCLTLSAQARTGDDRRAARLEIAAARREASPAYGPVRAKSPRSASGIRRWVTLHGFALNVEDRSRAISTR